MPTDGALINAAYRGALEEATTLLEARANTEEKDEVGDGTGISVASGF